MKVCCQFRGKCLNKGTTTTNYKLLTTTTTTTDYILSPKLYMVEVIFIFIDSGSKTEHSYLFT